MTKKEVNFRPAISYCYNCKYCEIKIIDISPENYHIDFLCEKNEFIIGGEDKAKNFICDEYQHI